MRIFFFYISISFLALAACNQKPSEEDKRVQDALAEIDSKKGEFNPAVAIDPQSSHWAVKGKYTGGQYQFDTTQVSVRKGRIPYNLRDKTGMPFQVNFFDQAGKLIGGYAIENPAELRSCEEGGPARRITEGIEFEILLPADANISTVQVQQEGKRLANFRVSAKRVTDDGAVRDSANIAKPNSI